MSLNTMKLPFPNAYSYNKYTGGRDSNTKMRIESAKSKNNFSLPVLQKVSKGAQNYTASSRMNDLSKVSSHKLKNIHKREGLSLL